MYRHILIATDGSELAEKAVTAGLELAKGLRARATAVTVSEPWVAARTCHGSVAVLPFDGFEKAGCDAATKTLAAVDGLAKQLDVECTTLHIKDNVAQGILQAAKRRGCDLIVMRRN